MSTSVVLTSQEKISSLAMTASARDITYTFSIEKVLIVHSIQISEFLEINFKRTKKILFY